MVPGWKGGKVLPLGGSLGEYSLNDLEEQPGEKGGHTHTRTQTNKEMNTTFPAAVLTLVKTFPGNDRIHNSKQNNDADQTQYDEGNSPASTVYIVELC